MILEFKNNKYIVYDDSGKVVIISSHKDVCISHIKTIKG
jgi:hypothetical protein